MSNCEEELKAGARQFFNEIQDQDRLPTAASVNGESDQSPQPPQPAEPQHSQPKKNTTGKKKRKRVRDEPGIFTRETKNLPNLVYEKVQSALAGTHNKPPKETDDEKLPEPNHPIKLAQRVAMSSIQPLIQLSQDQRNTISSILPDVKGKNKEKIEAATGKKFGMISIIKKLCEQEILRDFMIKAFENTKGDIMNDIHNHVRLSDRDCYTTECDEQIKKLKSKDYSVPSKSPKISKKSKKSKS